MNIFRNFNNKKTAKEHIESKRNKVLFYDLSNNQSVNLTACVKNKKITRFVNHSHLINISKGYYDYYQNGKCVDISNSLISEYEKETFKKDKCSIIKNTSTNNQSISTYNGIVLTNNGSPDSIINSTTNNIKHYSERTGQAITDFAKKPEKEKIKCFKLHSVHVKNM